MGSARVKRLTTCQAQLHVPHIDKIITGHETVKLDCVSSSWLLNSRSSLKSCLLLAPQIPFGSINTAMLLLPVHCRMQCSRRKCWIWFRYSISNIAINNYTKGHGESHCCNVSDTWWPLWHSVMFYIQPLILQTVIYQHKRIWVKSATLHWHSPFKSTTNTEVFTFY